MVGVVLAVSCEQCAYKIVRMGIHYTTWNFCVVCRFNFGTRPYNFTDEFSWLITRILLAYGSRHLPPFWCRYASRKYYSKAIPLPDFLFGRLGHNSCFWRTGHQFTLNNISTPIFFSSSLLWLQCKITTVDEYKSVRTFAILSTTMLVRLLDWQLFKQLLLDPVSKFKLLPALCSWAIRGCWRRYTI